MISTTTLAPPQLPLLYVVDGVRQARDRVPAISNDAIARVEVIKGSRALREYGPEASYGVVLITTKVSSPRT
ncbi:MAG TPA: TonB-dependent receptor plug domain-containing protein [Gemmatimonadaceae bacterium]|nr:TonB-dependent receptor plug domain-containing protein [Gemmatimonadaceae bacterium]